MSRPGSAEGRELRKALFDLYLEVERTAINGYAEYQGSNRWVFNDKKWRENDTEDGFRIAIAARRALGLRPIKIDREDPPYSWPDFRAKDPAP